MQCDRVRQKRLRRRLGRKRRQRKAAADRRAATDRREVVCALKAAHLRPCLDRVRNRAPNRPLPRQAARRARRHRKRPRRPKRVESDPHRNRRVRRLLKESTRDHPNTPRKVDLHQVDFIPRDAIITAMGRVKSKDTTHIPIPSLMIIGNDL